MNSNHEDIARKLTMAELNRLSPEDFKNAPKTKMVIILDNIRSQNNTGSIFRTADAFRLEAVFLCGITATPPHREIHKTALGATETVNWQYFADAAEAVAVLKSDGYRIIAVEQAHGSTMLHHFRTGTDEKTALIFGNEIDGVDEKILKICDDIIEIPQYGTKHSLNVAVSVGIVIWKLISDTICEDEV